MGLGSEIIICNRKFTTDPFSKYTVQLFNQVSYSQIDIQVVFLKIEKDVRFWLVKHYLLIPSLTLQFSESLQTFPNG